MEAIDIERERKAIDVTGQGGRGKRRQHGDDDSQKRVSL